MSCDLGRDRQGEVPPEWGQEDQKVLASPSWGPARQGPGRGWVGGHLLGFLQGVRFIAGQAYWILLRFLSSE